MATPRRVLQFQFGKEAGFAAKGAAGGAFEFENWAVIAAGGSPK